MAEAAKFSSKNIKEWLEKETGSIFIPVHAKAQKLLDDMRKNMEMLVDVSRMLLDNSGKEIEKRNMKTYGRARALNKLARLFADRMRQVKTPEKVTYDSLHEFIQETQKTFAVTDVDIRNYFPRISPFFILDRRRFQLVFEKAKEQLRGLNDFLTREYVKTKTLEETFQLIDKLNALENQVSNLSERRKKVESEKALVEQEIAETRQKMADLKTKGGVGQLRQIDTEIQELSMEVKHDLRHLQKPFVKLQSLSLHGGGSGLTQEEVKKLNHYLENPFEALASEESEYPILRQILQKLDRIMSEGKLKLKPDKTRKAKQALDNIVSKNSLGGLYKKCVDATARKSQLSASSEVAETKSGISKLDERLENLERRSKSVESEENTIVHAHGETSEKIRAHKNQIERNIFSFMGRRVRVE